MNNRVYAFVYDNYCIGGIQAYIYRVIRQLKADNYKIILVRDYRFPIDNSFRSVLCGSDIINIPINGFEGQLINIVKIHHVDLTIMTYRVIDMAHAQVVRNAFALGVVDVFYYVANFKGLDYYYEDIFSGKRKNEIRNHLGKIFKSLQQNDQIRYFSYSHIDEMVKRYSLNVVDRNAVKVRGVLEKIPFDEELRRQLFRSPVFNLLTISRFDFPHKGFIIGLIKEYGRLKRQYPQIVYTIVGYGAGLEQIISEIEKLSVDAKRDIHLMDKCAPEKMADYYDNANLNLSVAGCCFQGALRGCLSIPVRHFTYDCEVYGYLPSSKQLTSSDIPGQPVGPYIEEVLNMDEDTYVQKCKDSYETFLESKSTSSIFDRNINVSKLRDEDIKYIIKLKKEVDFLSKLKSRFDLVKKEGLLDYLKRVFKKIFR